MSDEEILNLLDKTLRTENAPPLTDSVVDAFLSTSDDCQQEAVDRMRARFIEKILSDLHQEPVRKVEEQPFGRWIEAERKKALLTPQDIGNAIGKDSSYIERIESSATFPWNLSSNEVVKLVCLFRIHVEAFTQLITGSFALSRTRLTNDVIGRSHGGKATSERGDSIKRALDLYLARKGKKDDLSQEVIDWLNEIRKHLERHQAKNLLE